MAHQAFKSIVLFAFVCLCLLSWGWTAWAQVKPMKKAGVAPGAAAVKLPDRLTNEEINSLMASLSDAQVRQLLIAQLKKAAAEPPRAKESAEPRHGIIARFWQALGEKPALLGTRLRFMFSGISAVPKEVSLALDRVTDGRGPSRLLEMLLGVIAVIGLGLFMEWVFRRLTVKARGRIETAPSAGGLFKLGRMALRTLFDLVSLGIFFVTSLALLTILIHTVGPGRQLAVAYLTAFLVVRVVAVVSTFILSPTAPTLRLWALGDGAARYLYRWIVLIAVVASFGWTTVLQLQLLGLSEEVGLLMRTLGGSGVALMVVYVVWQNRDRVGQAILEGAQGVMDRVSSLRAHMAQTWHGFAILYVFCVWAFWEAGVLLEGEDLVGPFLVSLLIVPVFIAVDQVLQGLLRITLGQNQIVHDQKAAGEPEVTDNGESAGQPSANRYLPVFLRSVHLLLVAALVLYLMHVWGVALPFGRAVRKAVFNVLVALFLAHVAWEFTKTTMDKKLADTQDQEGEGLEQVAGGTRIGTLLPLLRNFLLTVLLAMVTMIVLSSIGVNIGPLLAGAGVVGLAIGFGAQTLVRDIFSGIFFLIDDAFRIGDYVEAGSLKGMVEHISIRSLRLRHHRGMITTIPFGELKSVTNFTRDWIIMKLDFRVPYDTDIDKVRKIIKKIGQELEQDEELGSKLLEPVKSQGVRQLEDSAMIMRVKFKTKPGQQFAIRREVYSRLQKAFAKNGIRFAHRNVTIYLAPESSGATPGAEAGNGGAPSDARKGQVTAAGGAAAGVVLAEEKPKSP